MGAEGPLCREGKRVGTGISTYVDTTDGVVCPGGVRMSGVYF